MRSSTCGTISPWGNGCIKLAGHHLEGSQPCEDSNGWRWCGYCRTNGCERHEVSKGPEPEASDA